jgi:hypothetical protein
MRVECAWCGCWICDVPPEGGDVSHGMCQDCFAKELELRALTPGEFEYTLDAKPDAVVESFCIWYHGYRTLIRMGGLGWAFDVKLTPDQVVRNYEVNCVNKAYSDSGSAEDPDGG